MLLKNRTIYLFKLYLINFCTVEGFEHGNLF